MLSDMVQYFLGAEMDEGLVFPEVRYADENTAESFNVCQPQEDCRRKKMK